jgi:RimJ/RimL family protein N-acetyltransferase
MIFGNLVALGPILPTDLPDLYIWGDDPAISRLSEPYLPKNIARDGEFWLNSAGDVSRVFFAIRAHPPAEIIGHVQITAIHPIHRSAFLGILIAVCRAVRKPSTGTPVLC